MNLHLLNRLVTKQSEFVRFLKKLSGEDGTKINLFLPEAGYGIVIASTFAALQAPILFISARPELARKRYEQIKLWLPDEQNVIYFPEVDLLAVDRIQDPVLNSERLMTLSMLSGYDGIARDGQLPFIVTSALSLASKSMTRNALREACLELRVGSHAKPLALLEKIQSIGYEKDDTVELPGTFSKRGGIVDIFPSGRTLPIRLEFLGDEIESIREYDPRTQISIVAIPSFNIPPVVDLTSQGAANILDYIPETATLFIEDIQQIQSEIERIEQQAVGLEMADQPQEDVKKQEAWYFTWSEITAKLEKSKRIIELSAWGANPLQYGVEMSLQLENAPNYAARFNTFMENLADLRRENNRITIVSLQTERIKELLYEHGIDVCTLSTLDQLPEPGTLTLIQGSVDGGWRLNDEMLLLTDLELFGTIKQRRSMKPRPVKHHWFSLQDISIGDMVVHVEHGIARFAGVAIKSPAGVEREYLVLEYAGGDTLYVPVEQVDRVGLYIGGGEKVPALSKLGSQEWSRARRRVKESVENIANELILLYAGREAGNGIAFSPDTLWQKELEASFPYVETVDQLQAMQEVKADMESLKPMDRLVCGDVGYGKTEIAVRAAFKAIMDGKQVAVLVPTTILAQQHINTFKERLKAYPVRLDVLSRFCSKKEQSAVLKRLADGAVDLCIGTHRLLQKDVVFKDLGLVIIDEEQRFGVVHKEYFKKVRQSVDVLTLSATPIPRTMHMALSGIRDLSMIETPPENRLPVITYVTEFHDKLVREAILREMERDGQVFIVHNRVHSIDKLAYKIGQLVPEAKVSVAHGQMEEVKLERVMSDFMEGKSDVLVTTTIIESGLDMPNVNTLIINDADMLGLTQMYQLRGRVGRGANSAFSYFLFGSGKQLTEHARERLKTIAQASELGVGFAIAMKDLEIRGAGNLLGTEQSGNIASVGFNYYCQLLAEAVEDIRAKHNGQEINRKPTEAEVAIDLRIPAFIPENYVEDVRTRFNIYQRLARLPDLEMIEKIRSELVDRFGEIPEEAANLLYMVEMKYLASKTGIVESIYYINDFLIISLHSDASNTELRNLIKSRGVHIGNRQVKIDVASMDSDWKALLRSILINTRPLARV